MLSEQDKTQAKKLLTLSNKPELALFDELQEIKDVLIELSQKKMLEMPEINQLELTETNKLLTQLLEKLDVSITLTLV